MPLIEIAAAQSVRFATMDDSLYFTIITGVRYTLQISHRLNCTQSNLSVPVTLMLRFKTKINTSPQHVKTSKLDNKHQT